MPIIVDIETIPRQDLYPATPDWLKESKYYPNPKLVDLEQYKKDETKEKYRLQNEEMLANFEQERVKEFSVNAFLAEPIWITSCLVFNLQFDHWNLRQQAMSELANEIQHNLPLITFNGKRFDLPVLSLWCAKQGWAVEARRFSAFITSPFEFSIHIDLFNLFSHCPSLEYVSKLMRIEIEKHGEGSDIYQWYKKDNFDDIKKHCNADINITYQLAKKWGFII